jgi:predicted ATPase
MIKILRIRGLRGFRAFEVGELKRTNLFIGANNAGKTTVLEALLLHLGAYNPQLPVIVNAIRGFDRFATDPDDIWGWLFPGKDTTSTIEITTIREQAAEYSVRIFLRERKQTSISQTPEVRTAASTATSVVAGAAARELVIEYTDVGGAKMLSNAYVDGDQIVYQKGSITPTPQAIYLHFKAPRTQENPERLSGLKQVVGGDRELLESLRIIEPRLRELVILARGGPAAIYGDIGIGQLLPLSMLGDGINRLLTLLLSISAAPNGFVMVDEIENGFHYSVLRKVWQAIGDACNRNQVQLFAATHSLECVRAAHESFKIHQPYDLGLFRIERQNGASTAVALDEEELATATAMDLEIR